MVYQNETIQGGIVMQKIYLDFETYYDQLLTLTAMSTAQYVNHEDFSVWGVGIKVEDGQT